MRPEDRELYVLWFGTGADPAVITGRRNAWDAYRIRVGGLTPAEVVVARNHLENTSPTPVGEIRERLKDGKMVILYKAVEWVPPAVLPGS